MPAESCCANSGGPDCVSLAGIETSEVKIRETTPKLSGKDRLGILGMRWGIGRMNYSVAPGLYQIGNPDGNSPVLVTANYKLTFDLFRKELDGIAAWILVLNTHGINVWCAAGKGTFSTDEVVRQIEAADLKSIVSHKEIILPQLGAPGVAAHEVRRRTGFKVIYGPVYAKDIPAFLAGAKRVSPQMRKVQFGLRQRIVLIPMELIPALKWVPALIGLILIMRFAEGSGINTGIVADLVSYLGAIAMGTVVFQIILPWIPGRSFALKGWLLGTLWFLLWAVWIEPNLWVGISTFLAIPVIAAYLALNFTGSTTFTSLSGVQKEIRLSAPVMIGSAALGIMVRVASRMWI